MYYTFTWISLLNEDEITVHHVIGLQFIMLQGNISSCDWVTIHHMMNCFIPAQVMYNSLMIKERKLFKIYNIKYIYKGDSVMKSFVSCCTT